MSRTATSWRALGTYVYLCGDADTLVDATRIAADVLETVDKTYSRFRSDSELMTLYRRSGEDVPVSPLLHAAVRVALEAAEESEGLLDPTMGSQLVAAGYDRTFTRVPTTSSAAVDLPVRTSSWRAVVLGEGTLRLPARTLLDLGATGKAFAADLIAASLEAELGRAFLVSVGGDLRITASRAAAPYAVAVADTEAGLSGDQVYRISLTQGALATSSIAARQWHRDGRRWHHIIDPRTGEPAAGPWRTVTAYGHTAVGANTASTTALILGKAALGWLVQRSVAARLVSHDGVVTTTPLWDKAFGQVAA